MARDPHGWSTDSVRAWQRIGRDVVVTFLGGFMLIWQTLFAAAPSPLLVGAGLMLLGLPPALRIDELRDRMRGEDKDA